MLKMADEGGKGGVGGVVSQMLTIVDVGGVGVSQMPTIADQGGYVQTNLIKWVE